MAELVNADEVKDVEAQDMIRIVGSAEACEAAAQAIKTQTASSAGKSESNGQNAGQGRSGGSKVTRTIDVPSSLHRAVADGGRIFRRLPPGTNINHGNAALPAQNAARPKPFANGKPSASSARIDQEEDETSDDFAWEVVPLTDESASSLEETTIPWIISGNEAGVAKAEELVNASLEHARKATHLAHLQVPRSFMPRVVGRGGSGLSLLREEADVQVEVLGRKDADTLLLIGNPDNLEKARRQIMELRSQR